MNRAQRDDPLARLRPDRADWVAPSSARAPAGDGDVPVLMARGRHRTGVVPTVSRAAPTPSPPDALPPGPLPAWPRWPTMPTVKRLIGPLAVALASAVVAGGGLWWLSSDRDDQGFVLSAAATTQPASGPPVAPTGASPPASAGVAAAGQPAPTPGPSVTVHVAGAVATPGVVVIVGGSRVMDAVAAAGGLSGDADPGGINLARQVLDGELIVVPIPGQVVAVPVTGGVGGVGAGGAGPGGGLVDVNQADAAALDTLPGIGPVLAERIISYREDTGAFGDVEELRSVPGIGDKVFGGIRDLITV